MAMDRAVVAWQRIGNPPLNFISFSGAVHTDMGPPQSGQSVER